MADTQPAASKPPVVAFLGPEASYTHQAARSAFPGSQWDLLPVTTIHDVFEAVRLGQAAYGVVPFENSTHGPVTFTLASLADRDDVYGDLQVCGEAYLAVHHYLLGRQAKAGAGTPAAASSPTLPPHTRILSSLAHVRRLYSHPQAFGQTTAFVHAHLPAGIETIDASSTSRAAALAAADETGASAAISSALAAETTGLDVLASSIEDRPDNTTRFYVLGRRATPVPVHDATSEQAASASSSSSFTSPSPATSSLVSFTVSHRSPGALADVLDCFRRAGLNLTSINSLPSLKRPFQYLFFVEFEHSGAREEKDEGGRSRVQRALAEVADVAQTWRLIGSWAKPEALS